MQALERDRSVLEDRLAVSCDRCRVMRSHLDEFASLLETLTRASHAADHSHYVCGLAVKLEQTQHVLAELFRELSQATTERISAAGRGRHLLQCWVSLLVSYCALPPAKVWILGDAAIYPSLHLSV